MNFTLFSLSLANFSLTSPLFSPSFYSLSLFKAHTFSNLHITHSCQSFLFMKPYLSSLLHRQKSSISFTNSQFMHFLHSTISISDQSFKDKNNANILSNSDDDYKPRSFNREKIEYTIYSSEDLVLKANNCFFIECTEPISGGAINMICEESSLLISKCCFVNCFAQGQGGAISFFGNIFKINNTCFDGCYTMDSSMTMELYVKGSKEKMTLCRLSITNCADRRLFNIRHEEYKKTEDQMRDFDGMRQFGVYLSNVIDMNRGKQKLSAINSTNNIVHLGGGFCISDESKSFSLSFSTIVNNVADILFNLYDINFNSGNISNCNVLNNTASLSLTLFDLENSSISVSYTTFLQNNLTFVASNGNLRLENCAYDFNSKNPPLENAEFNEIGSIFHKLKNWRSAKTIAFDQEQIANNENIFGRCRNKKPRYSRRDEMMNPQFNGFHNNYNRYNEYNYDESDNKKENRGSDEIFDHKNEKIDDAIKKYGKNKNKDDEEDEDTDAKDKNKNNQNVNDNADENNNNNIFNNKNDNNDDIFNNKNDNKNNYKNRYNKNDDDEEDNDKKNNHNLNHFVQNQIKVDDNEEDEHEEEKNIQNNQIKEHSNSHSRTGLLIFVFILMIAGISIFVYIYFIKDKERDINNLQDVELL